MARAAVKALLAASAVWLSGCGTVANTSGMTREGRMLVYGGVRADVRGFQDAASRGDLPALTFCAADLPLSAVADTLTIPWTIAASGRAESPDEPTTPSVHTAPSGKTAVFPDPILIQ